MTDRAISVDPLDASPLLEATGLSFQYTKDQGVTDLTLSLRPGEVIALLGVNGAGKTTTLSMLSGCLAPHRGKITVDGYDLTESPRDAKRRLGYLPEMLPLYKDMRVREFLRFCAKLRGVCRNDLDRSIAEACDRTHLTPVKDRLIGHLSRGVRQRIGIAQALVHHPRVLILDEPTATLDPVERSNIQGLIRDIGQQHGVILSTHLLSEAEQLANRVFILHQGAFVHETILASSNNEISQLALQISGPGSDKAKLLLRTLPGVCAVHEQSEGSYLVEANPNNDPRNALARACLDQGWKLLALSPHQASLEQVFLQTVSGSSPS